MEEVMRVAVATEDGTSISSHFGRSAGFIVFTVADGKVTGREVRTNSHTPHAAGECDGEHHHDHGEHGHSHASVVEALSDCDGVICYGMGWRAAQDLASNGIRPIILAQEHTPDEAIALLIEGRLQVAEGHFCRCHE